MNAREEEKNARAVIMQMRGGLSLPLSLSLSLSLPLSLSLAVASGKIVHCLWIHSKYLEYMQDRKKNSINTRNYQNRMLYAQAHLPTRCLM